MRLTPRGGRDRIDGWADDPDTPGKKLLKVRVAAPPVDGAANAALVTLIAKALGVPKSGVAVVAGRTARVKTVEVAGTTATDLNRLG